MRGGAEMSGKPVRFRALRRRSADRDTPARPTDIPTITRRQLIGGVASVAGVSLLVTQTGQTAQALGLVASSQGTSGGATVSPSTVSGNVSWFAGVNPTDGLWHLLSLDTQGVRRSNVLGSGLPPLVNTARESVLLLGLTQQGALRSLTVDEQLADGTSRRVARLDETVVADPSTVWTVTPALAPDGVHLGLAFLGTVVTPVPLRPEKSASGSSPLQAAGPSITYRGLQLLAIDSGAASPYFPLEPKAGLINGPGIALTSTTVALYTRAVSPLPSSSGSLTVDFLATASYNGTAVAAPTEVLAGPFSESRVIGADGLGHVLRITGDDAVEVDDLTSATVVSRVTPFPDSLPFAARPVSTSVLPLGGNRLALVNVGRRVAAVLDTSSPQSVVVASLNVAGQGQADPTAGVAAADVQLARLYIPDPSGIRGGIWVLDLNTLSVVDRWLSSTSFDFVAVDPASHCVFAKASNSTVLFVFNSDGSTAGVTQVDPETTTPVASSATS